ncbi:zf-HC2 domain-containing protein, partial [Acidithiobacillus caldus]
MKEARVPPYRWFEEHPDIETLDRWRAGLLSEPVAQAVRAHVDGCSQCR